MPGLIVGMPVYNGSAHIAKALDSLLAQTYTDFALIISDNCSTDDTEEICREYERRDERVRFTKRETNRGATANYNGLVNMAEAEYFKWASSNDICKDTFFAKCISALEHNPNAVLCYPKTLLLNPSTNESTPYEDNLNLVCDDPVSRFVAVTKRLALCNVMNGVFRLRTLRSSSLMGNFIAGDKNMIAEIALAGQIVEVPEYLFIRKMDSETATKLKSEADVQAHIDPRHKNPVLFQYWVHIFSYIGRILQSNNISARQKFQLLAYLCRLSIRSRDHFYADMKEAWQRLVT